MALKQALAGNAFLPGQRWISNTEPELGLGLVLEFEDRRISVSFPAAEDLRSYASNNAPLTRVIYRKGDTIRDDAGNEITVTDVDEYQGFYTYTGKDAAGTRHEIPETRLDSFVQFSGPRQRLFAGQLDKLPQYELRNRTRREVAVQARAQGAGLLGARAQLLPHQLHIAHEVANRFAPRVLLADEVGLGKTIEAGLIIHQQLHTGRAQRVLIAVPENLQHQWLVEMLRRFNLHFALLDAERCLESENAFAETQLVLCSQFMLTEFADLREQALACEWDLLVVDEAHHLSWQEGAPSPEYAAIEALSQAAAGVLLLTATPEQLGLEGHFARLRLLDPARYSSLEAFVEEEQGYAQVNDWVRALQNADLPNDLPVEFSGQEPDAIIEQLLDRHGTGRVLFRNTRAAVKGFPGRELVAHALEGELLQSGDSPDWTKDDARIAWLTDWLKKNRREKALLICANEEMAQDIDYFLRLRGEHCTAFVESMTLLERDRAAAWFADAEDGAQILVCSEIGSEGRNFQFARHLIMFDLPANPDLIEQRIGRLDRIGQQHKVQIHVPYVEGSEQRRIMRWCDEGLNIFHRSCAVGHAVYSQFKDALESNGDIDTLIAETRQFTEDAMAQLERGRNQLLELNSCPPSARALVKTLESEQREAELAEFMSLALDQYGVDEEYHSQGAVIIRPGDHMLDDSFSNLPEDGITATYNRELALGREDMHFLTWEHPLVLEALDSIIHGEFGSTCVCSIKLPPLKPGTLLVEAVFTAHCPAPKSLQIERWLPNTLKRFLCDSEGRALEEIVTPEHLQKLCKKVQRRSGRELLRQARSQLEAMISRLEQRAAKASEELSSGALEKFLPAQQAEIDRMTALAKVNPSVRPEEVQFLVERKASATKLLSGARYQLDGLRVVLVT